METGSNSLKTAAHSVKMEGSEAGGEMLAQIVVILFTKKWRNFSQITVDSSCIKYLGV